MPAVQRSEFYLALNQVATERGVSVEVVLDSVKNAILAAYRKENPEIVPEEYSVTINPSTGEARVLHGEKDVTPPGFGRIAAQTAKQVILQKVREEEKAAIISDFKLKIGTVVNGMILRFAGPNIIVDIGKAEAIMPKDQQIPNEHYHMNQRLAIYIVEIREGARGSEVVVSRSHTGLLEGLLKREVPEVNAGTVIVKSIVREAGVRSKIAVAAKTTGVDPVGSCVGQKGVRIQAVIQEFGGLEKIDIIPYEENPVEYIKLALGPAKNLQVTIEEDKKEAEVLADKSELSSAIGKDGQNVKLASELTGYRINILEKESTEEPVEENTKEEAAEADKEKKEESELPVDTKEETPVEKSEEK